MVLKIALHYTCQKIKINIIILRLLIDWKLIAVIFKLNLLIQCFRLRKTEFNYRDTWQSSKVCIPSWKKILRFESAYHCSNQSFVHMMVSWHKRFFNKGLIRFGSSLWYAPIWLWVHCLFLDPSLYVPNPLCCRSVKWIVHFNGTIY